MGKMVTTYFVLMITFTVVGFISMDFTVAETINKTTKNLTNAVVSRSNSKFTQVFQSPKNSFSTWIGMVWNWLTANSDESFSEFRTFGHIRRLKNALIPIMFKFGVISTLIAVLVFLALKTIFLLKALLVLNLGGIIAKLIALKTSSGHDHHHYVTPPVWQPAGWSHNMPHWNSFGPPHTSNSHLPWATTLGQGKEIHVHIHNSPAELKSSSHYNSGSITSQHTNSWENEPYGGYSEIQKQYAVGPEQQQNLVRIHRDDNLNYVNNRQRYGKSLKR